MDYTWIEDYSETPCKTERVKGPRAVSSHLLSASSGRQQECVVLMEKVLSTAGCCAECCAHATSLTPQHSWQLLLPFLLHKRVN